MTSSQAQIQQLADAVRKNAVQAGASSPEVRGADWQTAAVTAVNGDGTVNIGVIVARCLDSYSTPTVGDVIYLTQSGAGNWVAVGRTSSSSTGVGGFIFRRKTADDAVPNSLTMATDTHLVAPVTTNAVYTIDGQLFVLGADFTSDIRLGYAYPAGGELHFGGPGPHTTMAVGGEADGEFVARQSPDGIGTFIPYGTSTSRIGIPLKGLLITGGTAGNLSVQWARNVTGSGTVTVRAGSWLKLQRMS